MILKRAEKSALTLLTRESRKKGSANIMIAFATQQDAMMSPPWLRTLSIWMKVMDRRRYDQFPSQSVPAKLSAHGSTLRVNIRSVGGGPNLSRPAQDSRTPAMRQQRRYAAQCLAVHI